MRVAVRLRPLSPWETERGESNIWSFDKEKSTVVERIAKQGVDAASPTPDPVPFDYVCPPDEPTSDLYKNFVRKAVTSTCEGINGTVFAYGQTASGKTYTVTGSAQVPGMIFLAIGDIFNFIKTHPDRQFLIRVSCFEVYNEQVNDLLGSGKNLKVLDKAPSDTQAGIIDITGLTQRFVQSPEQFLDSLLSWEANRRIAATSANARSSRSHTIFRILIESRPIASAAEVAKFGVVTRSAALHLVDLAGSECVGQFRDDHKRQTECKHINRSLFGLSRVVMKLSELRNKVDSPAAGHVPYRDCKLTRILRPSLGGNSQTLFVCTLNPTHQCWEESINTLRFGAQARQVQQAASVNEVPDERRVRHSQETRIRELEAALAKIGGDYQSARADVQRLQALVQYQVEQLEAAQRDKEARDRDAERERVLIAAARAEVDSQQANYSRQRELDLAAVRELQASGEAKAAEIERLATENATLNQRNRGLMHDNAELRGDAKELQGELALALEARRVEQEEHAAELNKSKQAQAALTAELGKLRTLAMTNGCKLDKLVGRAANVSTDTAKRHPVKLWLDPLGNILHWKHTSGPVRTVRSILLSTVTQMTLGTAPAPADSPAQAKPNDDKQSASAPAPGPQPEAKAAEVPAVPVPKRGSRSQLKESDLSFSLGSATRTLHLVCKDEEAFALWTRGLQPLLSARAVLTDLRGQNKQ